MKRIAIILTFVFCLSACVGTSTQLMSGVSDKDKTAALAYTSVGLTSQFEFKGIATGTYQSVGHESGIVHHSGSQNIRLTIDAAQQWSVDAESKREGYTAPGLSVRLHNPYVAAVTRGGKTIGTIGISMPQVDQAGEALKFVGLQNVVQRNLHLAGKANILGKTYEIDSVYENDKGEKKDAPLGYKVSSKGSLLGLVQVGKNMAGGQALTLFIKPGLAPLVEQSVVAALLVCGYAV